MNDTIHLPTVFGPTVGETIHRHRPKILLLIFVTAFVVRVAATIGTGVDAPLPAGSDAVSYDAFAKKIVVGDWIDKPVSYREIGYPFFLSLVYRVAGQQPAAARVANAILGALACVLIFLLAETIFGGGIAGVASLWSVFNFHFVFYNTMVLRETMVTLLVVLFLICLLRATTVYSWRRLLVAAAVFVAVVHTDARFLFHFPFVIIYLLVTVRPFRRSVLAVTVFGLFFLIGMIPWQYRNYVAYDRFVLVNTRTLSMQLPWKTGTPVSDGEADVTQESSNTAEKRQLAGFRRVVYDFTEFYRVFRFRGEVRNNSTTYEKPWSTRHNAASIFTYGLLVPFFVAGIWIVARNRWRPAYVLLLPVAAHTLLHLIKWGRPRYRTPVEPAIIILGVFGLLYLLERLRSRRREVAT